MSSTLKSVEDTQAAEILCGFMISRITEEKDREFYRGMFKEVGAEKTLRPLLNRLAIRGKEDIQEPYRIRFFKAAMEYSAEVTIDQLIRVAEEALGTPWK